MKKYANDTCFLCKNELKDEEQNVVVCEICGAAQHRECYETENQCVCTNRHDDPAFIKQLARQRYEDEPAENDTGENEVCSVCGIKPENNSLRCENCASPIYRRIKFNEDPNGDKNYQSKMDYNKERMYYGGVHPGDTIDGISAREMATFVGTASPSYLPKFFIMRHLRLPIGLNLYAALLQPFYFAFRKMKKMTIIALILFLIPIILNVFVFTEYTVKISNYLSTLPADSISNLEQITSAISDADQSEFKLTYLSETLANLSTATRILTFTYFLLFGNMHYKNDVVNKIKLIRKQSNDKSEYFRKLHENGGTDFRYFSVVIIVYIVGFAIAFCSVYPLISYVMSLNT